MLLTIIASPLGMLADEASYVFNTDAGISALGITKPSSGSGTSLSTTTPYNVGQISMSVTHGSTDTRVWNSNGTLDLRIYKSGGSLTFSAASGYNITGITILGNTVANFSANVGTFSDGSWSNGTDGFSSVILTATNTGKINTITVTYSSTGGSSATATTTTIDYSGITNTDVYVSTVAGSLSATVTPDGGAALVNPSITWSSSNTGVATIESNGTVTLVAAGVTTITASYAGVANTYAASSATYNLTVTSSAPDYAVLPFSWAGGVKNDLTDITGVSASGLGSDYAAGNAPYRVKFDTDGDYIQIKTDSKPGVVRIGVKMIGGGSTSKITVKASSNGSTFDIGQELTISGSQNDVVNLTSTRTFDSEVRYIRLVFTKGDNVGVGPISISKEQYDVTCAYVYNGNISSDKTKASAGETVTLTATPSPHYTFTSWSVYKTGDAGTTVTVSDNKFTMPAYAVTVSATFTAMTIRNITIPEEIEDNVIVDATNNQAYYGDDVTITVEAPDGQYLTSLTVTGAVSSSSVSLSPAVSSEEDEYTFTMPDEDVTIAATFGGNYTVRFSVNGEIDHQETVSIGNSTTLPGSATEPEGFDFVGWTQSGGVDILDSPYTPNSDVTLYAVYSRTEQELQPFYVLVESDLGANNWAGDYLIAYSSTKFADGRVGGTATGGIGAEGVSVNPGSNLDGKEITATWGDKYNVTLEAITDGYVMITKDGKYNYQTGNSNGLPSTDNLTTASNYPISVTFTNSSDIKLKNSSGAAFRYNESGYFRFYKDCGQSAVYLYRRQYVSKNVTKYYTQVLENNFTATAPMTITTPVLIQNGKVFNMDGNALTNGDAANLIIEDGGQLICNNSVAATVKKSITASTASKGEGWYTISSPVNNKTAGGKNYETVAGVTNLVPATGKYDLYRFNETKNDVGTALRWENYKVHNYDLEMGRGYIYRKDNTDALSFVGNTNVGDITYTLTCSDVPELAGFNLIGNPYPHSIAKGSGKAIQNGDYLATNYYVLSNNDTWDLCTDGSEIPSKQGILVQTVEGFNLTISDTPFTPVPGKYSNDNIRFSVANEQYEDVAYAWFDKGYGLNKIAHRNPDAPMLYIPQDGTNYATAIMSDDIKVFGLSFKAMTMGKYTLRTKANGDYTYLHVIDRLTGEDVDMLLDGEYSFVASPNDKENRFIVKLEYKPDYSEGNSDIFAYQSGSEILVSGEGELQIFDVTGRNVMTTTINGAEAINGLSNGVYVFSLVGNDIKTQKIVVR